MNEVDCKASHPGVLTRTITKTECSWLEIDLPKGTVIFKFEEYDYGCCTESGTPCCLERNTYPFIEIPKDAILWDPK